LGGRVLYGNSGPARLEGGEVVVGGQGPLDLGQYQLLGAHNLVNACGAITAASLLTGELPELHRLEHELCAVSAPRSRLEPIGERDGVTYVDDALASNPEGTIAALRMFAGKHVALIVGGGNDRGLDFAPLARVIEASSPQPVVVWLDRAGAAIAAALDQLSSGAARRVAPTLEEAVAIASCSPDVEVVLFSPAAPTPHAEGTYLDRSRRFREAAGPAKTAELGRRSR
jgi:UDP-N-acetylmuramoylalanine--D-glutamate ligase